MENTTQRREVDFRLQPPTKTPPTQFKVRAKSRIPKKTLLSGGLFALATVLLYTLVPSPLPNLVQKSLGCAYAVAAGLFVWTAVRELWKKLPPPNVQHADTNSLLAKEIKEQKEHLLQHVGAHHRYAQGRKRWAAIGGILAFAGMTAIWFTPYAPIDAKVIEIDLDQALADSATNCLLNLTDPAMPLIRFPLPSLASRLAAEGRRSGDAYRAANQLLALGEYDEARIVLDALKKEGSADAAQKTKIDLALAQSFLFEGRPAEAMKVLKPLDKKDSAVLAHTVAAMLLAGQYREAREGANQLHLAAKAGTLEDKARALNFLLAINALNWRKDERLKYENEGKSIKFDETAGVHTASLQNNLGVLKSFSNPPQYVSVQSFCRLSLDIRDQLDLASNLPEGMRDPIEAATEQNIGVALWCLGEYENSQKQIDASQRTRQAGGKSAAKRPENAAEQTVKLRGELATGLSDYTLGQYVKLRNTLEDARSLSGGIGRSDPHRIALKLLEMRNDLVSQRFSSAELRGLEILKEATVLTNSHPALNAARLRAAEAYLENGKPTEAKKMLDDALAGMNDIGAAEHQEMLTYWRLLAQYEIFAGRPGNAKGALDRGEALAKRMLLDKQTGKPRPNVEVAMMQSLRALMALSVWKSDPTKASGPLAAALGFWQEAEKEYIAAIGDNYGVGHPQVGRFIQFQAQALLNLKRASEAEKRMAEWREVYLESYPPDHPWAADGLDFSAKLVEATNKDEAIEYRKRAKTIRDLYNKLER